MIFKSKFDRLINIKKSEERWAEERKKIDLEKKDRPAMIIAAFLVFIPAILVVVLLFLLVIWIFFLKK